MNRISMDPFLESVARPYSRQLSVLGADFSVCSNEPHLLELVDLAFGGLPSHANDCEPRHLRVDLVLNSRPDGERYVQPPPLRYSSGANLIVGAFDAANFSVISVPQRSALIGVDARMLEHPYELRYELIEFTFLTLASRSLGLVPLHAACVGIGERGLLLNGPTGSGKSTLSLACTLSGFGLVSDDAVFVSPERLLATGCPNFLHLTAESLRFCSDAPAAEAIARAPVIRRRSGVAKHQVDLRHSPFTPGPVPLTLAALILLSPERRDTAALLTELTPEEALKELESDKPYAVGQPQWAAFRQTLAAIPAYRLARAERPELAAKALRDLLAADS